MLQETLIPELETNLEVITDSFRQQFLRFQRGEAAKRLARHQTEDAAHAALPTDRNLDLQSSEVRRYSITRAIQERHQSILGKRPACGLEHECHQALVQRRSSSADPLPAGRILIPADVLSRSMSATPGAKGGYLTATSSLSFLDLLRSNAVVFKLGARHVIGQVGNVSVAKQLTGATTTWLGASGSAATESEPTFGQLTASPKILMTFTQKSVQLNRQMDPAGEFFC